MKLFTHVAFLMLFALPLFASAQTTPLRILEKPRPEPSKYLGHVEGVVRLKVIFLSSGKIGDVTVVSQLTKELGELAAAAAKKIKFEPKIVDGAPVSVARIVDYPYNEENGGWEGSTQPLRILERPKPELPKDYGQLDVIDSFYLRVEFLANGKIGKVVLISGTHKELARLATQAAKRIKFKPKMENGVPVDSFLVVQYSYSWDGFWRGSTKPSTSRRGPSNSSEPRTQPSLTRWTNYAWEESTR